MIKLLVPNIQFVHGDGRHGCLVCAQPKAMDCSAPHFLVLCIAVVALIGLSWMIRGVVTSGYVAYPSTFGSLPVDWKMPEEDVKIEADWVYAWGRAPNTQAKDVVGKWDGSDRGFLG